MPMERPGGPGAGESQEAVRTLESVDVRQKRPTPAFKAPFSLRWDQSFWIREGEQSGGGGTPLSEASG